MADIGATSTQLLDGSAAKTELVSGAGVIVTSTQLLDGSAAKTEFVSGAGVIVTSTQLASVLGDPLLRMLPGSATGATGIRDYPPLPRITPGT